MPHYFCGVLILLLTCSANIAITRKISNIFTSNFTVPGYYLVTTIPRGATSINVTEITKTVNFLAVKLENGEFLFNGNNDVSSSGSFKAVGTNFIYIRRNHNNSENFYASGPLEHAIRVMLLYNQLQPKILYQYTLPLNIESSSTTPLMSKNSVNIMMGDQFKLSTVPSKRIRKRKFVWHTRWTKCTKTCGGGYQSKILICVRVYLKSNNLVQVPDSKCNALKKWEPITLRCNSHPCLPQWELGQWSQCSVICGNGTRTREHQCMQKMSDKIDLHVDSKRCPLERPDDVLIEPCYMPDCNMYTMTGSNVITRQPNTTSYWKVEEWSECSKSCGFGKRSRVVTCHRSEKHCNLKEKPFSEEICYMGDCKTKSIDRNEIPEALIDKSWMYSDWPSQCSSECGTGILSRIVYCESLLHNETCSSKNMPSINRTCISDRICGQWFTGPWSRCSSSCGLGIQTREVICMHRLLGKFKVIDPINCQQEKPNTIMWCTSPPCNATWFMSDWSNCSRSCGKGSQVREVKCIRPDGKPLNGNESECEDEVKPTNKRSCNDIPCNDTNFDKTNYITVDNTQNINDKACTDTLDTCWSIWHKENGFEKKCQINLYKKACCKACSNLKPHSLYKSKFNTNKP